MHQCDTFRPRVASVHHLTAEATISQSPDFKAPLARVCSPQKVNGDNTGTEKLILAKYPAVTRLDKNLDVCALALIRSYTGHIAFSWW
jgi:hypothetical protein